MYIIDKRSSDVTKIFLIKLYLKKNVNLKNDIIMTKIHRHEVTVYAYARIEIKCCNTWIIITN